MFPRPHQPQQAAPHGVQGWGRANPAARMGKKILLPAEIQGEGGRDPTWKRIVPGMVVVTPSTCSHGETQPNTSTLLLCTKTHGRAAGEDWRGGRGAPGAAGKLQEAFTPTLAVTAIPRTHVEDPTPRQGILTCGLCSLSHSQG